MATNTNYDTAGVHLLVFVVLCNLTLNNIGLLERYKILFQVSVRGHLYWFSSYDTDLGTCGCNNFCV